MHLCTLGVGTRSSVGLAVAIPTKNPNPGEKDRRVVGAPVPGGGPTGVEPVTKWLSKPFGRLRCTTGPPRAHTYATISQFRMRRRYMMHHRGPR